MASYYDILLLAIPSALGVGLVVSLHDAISFHQGLVFGTMLSTVVLFEAMVRNPPVEPARPEVAASVLVILAWLTSGTLYVL